MTQESNRPKKVAVERSLSVFIVDASSDWSQGQASFLCVLRSFIEAFNFSRSCGSLFYRILSHELREDAGQLQFIIHLLLQFQQSLEEPCDRFVVLRFIREIVLFHRVVL